MIQKYDQYKDSGVEWIGSIPSTWETIKIKWTTPVKRGASPRPIADPKYFDDEGEFSWVRIADVTASERYLYTTTDQLSELGASLSVKQFPGDLFLSIAGSVGKPIITKIKCCIHDGFVWFPELKINPEYLFYLFQSGLPFIGLGKVGTQLNLNTETIGNIQVPVSSNQEVDKIVEYLDHQTRLIDAIIEKKKLLIEKLKEQRQSIINEAVTRGLDPNAPMKDSGVEWLGEIPEHWDRKPLKNLATYNDETLNDSTPEDQKFKYVEIGDVSLDRGIEKFQTTTYKDAPSRARRIVRENDIIVSTVRTYLKAIAKIEQEQDGYIVSTGFAVIRSRNIIPEYLSLLVQSENFIDEIIANSVGVSYPAINASDLMKIKIPVPNKAEQTAIAQKLQSSTSDIYHSIVEIENSLKKLKEYRQSIISEAVTGKIDVREWKAQSKQTA